MSEKPIKEMTQAEREAFFDDLRQKAEKDPETLETLIKISDLVKDLKEDLNTDYIQDILKAASTTEADLKEGRSTAQGIYLALKEALPVMLEETQKDPDAATMTPHEFIESGKFDEIASKVAARLNNTDLTADDIKEALPQLASVLPQKHVIPNSKLSNSLVKDDLIGTGETWLDVGNKKSDITTRVILSYEGDNVTFSGRQPYTEYDRQVYDGVCSLYEYGDECHIFTAAQAYRAMVNDTDTDTPSPQQIGAVTKSLDKMRFIRARIDCTEELTRRKLSLDGEQITGGKIDTYLLALEKVEVLTGTQKVAAYKMIKKPILYEYSQHTGQVITTEAALLDIRDKTGARISNTERRIAVKGYLLRRVAVMKGKQGKKQSHNILYESLYSDACPDMNTDDKKEKRRIRQYVQDVLEHFKREHYIKGYEEYRTGRAITGVEIRL